LLSIGQLCDNGCITTFNKTHVSVTLNNIHLFSGPRDANGLWRIHLPAKPSQATPPPNQANAVRHTPPHQANAALTSSTTSDLMTFLHASLFSPVPSTLIKAIQNNHFTTWPGLTTANVRRHLPKSMATTLGHLDQERKNLRSTKPSIIPADLPSDHDDIEDEFLPSPPITNGLTTNFAYTAIEALPTRKGSIATDQTGRFPILSSSGMRYVIILYDYDSNAILAEPLRNRTGPEIHRAYKKLHQVLVSHGLRPKLQRLDNECSTLLKKFMTEEQVDFQLVPPHLHRRNAAERAIRTWKNHFIAGLCTVDPNFPLTLWDSLIPQASLTLNLLRASRINPKLSAYAQIFGNYDFNRTPIAPPGLRTIAHEKPSHRSSWAPHGEPGWYVGPALQHYRCYTIFVSKTNAKRICDTVEFFPHAFTMPQTSSADAAQHAARDLIAALQHAHPSGTNYQFGAAQLTALRHLSAIFGAACPRVANTLPPKPTSNLPTATATPASPPPIRPALIEPEPHALFATSIPAQLTPETPLKDMFLEPPHQDQFSPFFASSVIDPDTGQSMEYKELITNPKTRTVWQQSAANEFGRLAQGLPKRGIKGTDTIVFIPRSGVPKGHSVTYARFVCVERPMKTEVARTRLTVGGNLIDYPGDTHAPTADITSFKLHVNSTLSTPGAKMMCADVKNFYLNTPMDKPEYMRIPLHLIPIEIQDEYNLLPLADNDYIYVKIQKGMYELPQAGILANKLLAKRLAVHGYYQARHSPGLWLHAFRPISFVLVVDDFAIKYVGKEHAHHLLAILKRDYEGVSLDWNALLYCGISVSWDYINRTAALSMPGYIASALHKFNHPTPSRPQYSPHKHNAPQYGTKVQLTDPQDTTPRLNAADTKRIQQIVGTLLYYARAVDGTALVALSSLSSQQSKATEATQTAVHQLLDYFATLPNAILKFSASDMILKIHSDAGYLNETKARSRAGGHFFLGNQPNKPEVTNGAILNPTGILKHIASSATEAEVGALFVNTKEGEIVRTTLSEMGFPQPATPVTTDNSTANGIMNDTIRRQRSRAIDMRYHWVRDRVVQKHFNIFWEPGSKNLGDYFTKHHAPTHHKNIRPTYLAQALLSLTPSALRGCVNPNPIQRTMDRRSTSRPTATDLLCRLANGLANGQTARRVTARTMAA
jgi:hypothetical protein